MRGSPCVEGAVLVTVLLLVLFFQESDPHDHATPDNSSQQISFEPVTSGNIIPLGNFQALIPEGVVYAMEEDAPLMVGLLGAAEIPNCVGVFYSDSNSFKYGVAIQHFGGMPFRAIELMPGSFFQDVFSQRHFLTLAPFTGKAELYTDPVFSDDGSSVLLGFRYTGNKDNVRHDGVILKKLMVSKNEAVVATARVADVKEFDTYQHEIMAVFDNLTKVQEGQEIAGDPISYFELLGISVEVNPNRVELGLPVILGSIGLAIFGLGLLVFAIKLSRKSNGDSLEPQE